MKTDAGATPPRGCAPLSILLRHAAAIALGLGLAGGVAVAQPPAEPIALGERLPPLLEWLDRESPEIRAMAFESEAAKERIYPAGALPDPMVTIEESGISLGNPTLSPSEVGGTRYAIRQTIPLGGRRDLARQVAEAGADQALARERLTRTELRSQVKLAFNQYTFAHEAFRVTEELRALASELERIAHARYGVGLTPQQDVIKAQTERTALQSELLMLERDRRQMAARLNGLLSRPAAAPLLAPVGWPELPAVMPTLAELQSRAASGNPQLAEVSARIEQTKRRQELARRNWYPDLTLGTALMQQGDRADEVELMVEVNIPLQWKARRSEQREATAMRYAAEAKREAMASRLSGEIGEAWAAFETASRQHELTEKTLLPQAELTYQSALASYQTGKVDFATLLDAQRQIRQLRLALLKLQLEQRLRVIELERLVGEEL